MSAGVLRVVRWRWPLEGVPLKIRSTIFDVPPACPMVRVSIGAAFLDPEGKVRILCEHGEIVGVHPADLDSLAEDLRRSPHTTG